MVLTDLDAPEHALCSEALKRSSDKNIELRGEIVRLKMLIESGRAAHNEERVARDWLAREKERLETRVTALESSVGGLDPKAKPGLHYPTALDVLRLAVEAHIDVATSMKRDVADWCESIGPLTEALDEIRAGLGMSPYEGDDEDADG
jgi:hypothetical protein